LPPESTPASSGNDGSCSSACPPANSLPQPARSSITTWPAPPCACGASTSGDQYKLTQKIPAQQPGPVQGLITNIYLSEAEHSQLVAALPGRRLAKTRYSIPPLGIDVFDPPLHGLVTAEAEFGTDAEMLAFQPPGYVHAEITDDPRFTGGRLAVAPREDLISWLAQYGISPDDPDLNQRG
jgi:CYTH domain-containing protein